MSEKEIIVVGHKNPDTDSICSAIAYAYLKKCITGDNYVARRAGHINEETKYVLSKFKAERPEYLKDVNPQVKDIDIRKTPGVSADISLKEAWNIMQDDNLVTLPITKENRLQGLITVGDITQSYMDVYDNTILAKAKTSYQNIASTLEGNLLVGELSEVVSSGKVLVAAAAIDVIESQIEKGDLVILGNRAEIQLCAIEMGAAAIIVCDNVPVSKTIEKLARQNDCHIITTAYDVYTAARLINQSMPVSYFMKTEKLVTFHYDDFLENIQDVMAKKRIRDFPILDKNGYYLGMISRRNLLGARRKQVILMDHNEKGQSVDGIEKAEILEIIDHHRLGSLETINPVFFRNQPLGSTSSIVYMMYQEAGVEIPKKIAGLLCAAIVSDTLLYKSPTCTAIDKEAAEALALIAGVKTESLAKGMFNAGSDLGNRSTEDIFYQDYKRFTINDTAIGVGQINLMGKEEILETKERIAEYMASASLKEDAVFFLLTNIMEESSLLLYHGHNAESIISQAFELEWDGECVVLPGVVSRKKQFLPPVMEVLQQ